MRNFIDVMCGGFGGSVLQVWLPTFTVQGLVWNVQLLRGRNPVFPPRRRYPGAPPPPPPPSPSWLIFLMWSLECDKLFDGIFGLGVRLVIHCYGDAKFWRQFRSEI